MPSPSSSLSSALAALGDSIAGLGAGLKSIADKALDAESSAQSTQETADAAIPTSQTGLVPGDVVVLDETGCLPVVDGTLLINLPVPQAPDAIWDLRECREIEERNRPATNRGATTRADSISREWRTTNARRFANP